MSEPTCGKLVGKGTIQYPCIVSGRDHDGPCAATEIGPSVVERRRWLAAQAEGTQAEPKIVQSQSDARSNGFTSQEDRLVEAGMSLKGELSSLPAAIQSWLSGASAQIALVQIWTAWKKAREDGETVLVLTGEEIDLLVPEKLRI